MPCYILYDQDRKPVGHICGKLGEHCAECGSVSTNLCDYVVGKRSKTCDKALCDHHANEVGHDRHYCMEHFALFKEEGGEQLRLDGFYTSD
ncbi:MULTISPECIES: hypothetical protein [unclassified Pseudomonas]|uniref:hypothetical protein n=1 Tax=unclassified Pseudomonas TaxID=196821 RepID=UPI001C60E209|nr:MULTISPECIES: hypothetical protein [unclassified Pseudomonas]MBW5416080.1 hypothetical protein [Pseudomonas sp. MAG002Y]